MSEVELNDMELNVVDSDAVETIVEIGNLLIEKIFAKDSVECIEELVEQGAPLWYQDDGGNSALHAAAHNEDEKLVDFLLKKGAIWNAVDNLGNTAGDIALSLNNEACYRLIRDAGLRTELLLKHLEKKDSDDMPTNVLRVQDSTAAGSLEEYLKSPLRYTTDSSDQEVCLMNIGGEDIGVMMGWERGIMQETVNQLCEGLCDYNVLNVGFGLGIIDSMFQSHSPPPKRHVIIEAHPDVLRHMRGRGWFEKPGVTILQGRWQDFVESDELLGVGGFDVVYTDTFSEDYRALQQFFDHLPNLLSGQGARFSFFNGLGATNALFYDVCTQMADLHLAEVGVNVTWSDVDVIGGSDDSVDRWNGTRNYFKMKLYRLPIGRM